MNKQILFCFFLLLFFKVVSAQQFGAFPPSTKWKQINTDTARIVFDPAVTAEAQRVAAIVHAMAAANPLSNSVQKINIVLHNKTTLANGYVGLAPYRSEYYLIPGGDIFDFGSLPWHEQLAVHEYRHVQQYNAFNRGFTKAFSALLGEEGRALANSITVPDWFFEGDAVYAETALTPQGRGRMPYFLKGYAALWKEGRSYDWQKLRNGSLKHFVPNHYPLGYLLVNYGYEKYGSDFWKKVTADASAFKGVLYPFQKAVKRHAGIDFKTFRTDALKWYSHEVSRKRSDFKKLEPVTHYYYPQAIGNDSILYVKESYKSLPHFYIKDGRGEQAIKLKNITSEDWFSYKNKTVAYTSYNTNARWSLINYSDIILLDLATKTERKITSKSKYFTPDLALDGQTIIAVSVSDSIQSSLHILDKNGQLIKAFNAPPSVFFLQPRFINDSVIAVGLRHPDAQISWEGLHLNTRTFETLLPKTSATIGFPFVADNFFYFTSSQNGADNIYRLSLLNKKLQQLTSGGTGHYFPSVYNDTLYWSSYTSNGFKIEKKPLQNTVVAAVPVQQVAVNNPPFPVAAANSGVNILAPSQRLFSATSYKKSSGLLNFHSWRPFYERPEASFSVYSNNVLNTFASELVYRYNENERSHTLGAAAFYGGWLPVLSAGADYTFNRHIRTATNTFTFNQTEARFGYSVPLNFTGGKTVKLLNFGSNFVYNNLLPTGATKQRYNQDGTTYLHHFVTWQQQLPRAAMQIFPKLAYSFSTAYRHRTDSKGYQLTGTAQAFLPAFFPTHSLQLSGSFQQVDTGNVLFSNRFAHSRGYNNRYFSRMWRGSANYHLPLLYPDKGVANIVYLLRVRSNIFYDYTRVFSKDRLAFNNLKSTGVEVFFDTRWWNQLPVSFGVRYSYLLDAKLAGMNNPNVFEIVLPVNLIPN